MMMRAGLLFLSLGLLSVGAQASVFKSECTLDKAVKNEALNATLGVKGGCDADKLVRQQKEKVSAEVKKSTSSVLDDKKSGLNEKRDDLKATQDKINQAGKRASRRRRRAKSSTG